MSWQTIFSLVGEIEMISPREAEMRARDKSCHQPGSLVPTVPEVIPLLPVVSQVPSIKHSSLIKSGVGVSIACYPESPGRCNLPMDFTITRK